jgi:superfamily II DNA/RNA helicase
MKYSLIIGGHDYTGQFESLISNPDIVVSTPGRMLEILLGT